MSEAKYSRQRYLKYTYSQVIQSSSLNTSPKCLTYIPVKIENEILGSPLQNLCQSAVFAKDCLVTTSLRTQKTNLAPATIFKI